MNTGKKIYRWLKEINVNTGQPTGNRKSNLPSDPDYIAPITDLVACPLPNTNNPTVTIRWSDNNAPTNVYADRDCSTGNCSYQINVDALDGDNDIQTKQVLISYDQGGTWSEIISNLSGNSFGDNLFGFPSKWYKVVITDSQPISATSNVLKISATEIGIGDLVLVLNGIERVPSNNNTPIVISNGSLISLMVRNRSTNQIVQLHDISPFGGTGVACTLETLGGSVVNGVYQTRPQIGEFIAPNNGWLPLVLQNVSPGNYIIRIAVNFPQDTGFPPLYLHTYFWWITVN